MVTVQPLGPCDLFRANRAILCSPFRERALGFFLDAMAQMPHHSLRVDTPDGTIIALALGRPNPPPEVPESRRSPLAGVAPTPGPYRHDGGGQTTRMWSFLIDYPMYTYTYTEDTLFFVLACLSLVKKRLALEFCLDRRESHLRFMYLTQGFVLVSGDSGVEPGCLVYRKYLANLKDVLPDNYYFPQRINPPPRKAIQSEP